MTSSETLEMPALPLTDQHTLDVLYKAFHLVDLALEKHGVPYFMIGGTLLGARRHGGVIPWDDDGDLAVELRHFAKVRQLVVPELESLGVGCSFGRMGNLKLYPLEGRLLLSEGNVSRPPFEKIDGRWTFFSPACRERWEGQYFEGSELERLERVPFGPLEMPAPSAAACESYLRRTYGDSYYTRGVICYSHISSTPIPPSRLRSRTGDRAYPPRSIWLSRIANKDSKPLYCNANQPQMATLFWTMRVRYPAPCRRIARCARCPVTNGGKTPGREVWHL